MIERMRNDRKKSNWNENEVHSHTMENKGRGINTGKEKRLTRGC